MMNPRNHPGHARCGHVKPATAIPVHSEQAYDVNANAYEMFIEILKKKLRMFHDRFGPDPVTEATEVEPVVSIEFTPRPAVGVEHARIDVDKSPRRAEDELVKVLTGRTRLDGEECKWNPSEQRVGLAEEVAEGREHVLGGPAVPQVVVARVDEQRARTMRRDQAREEVGTGRERRPAEPEVDHPDPGEVLLQGFPEPD